MSLLVPAHVFKVAQEEGVSLLKLIAEASTIDRKAPSESLLRDVAKKLK